MFTKSVGLYRSKNDFPKFAACGFRSSQDQNKSLNKRDVRLKVTVAMQVPTLVPLHQ